ncbi:MAG: AbrB/MazE/SpoVT family DNA-binding domain-containing protein [Candidatus Hodarchaeota archaeon]
MPEEQIRKVIRVGNSHAVTIPRTWLSHYERIGGKKLTEVVVETNGKLIIRPILKEVDKDEQ